MSEVIKDVKMTSEVALLRITVPVGGSYMLTTGEGDREVTDHERCYGVSEGAISLTPQWAEDFAFEEGTEEMHRAPFYQAADTDDRQDASDRGNAERRAVRINAPEEVLITNDTDVPSTYFCFAWHDLSIIATGSNFGTYQKDDIFTLPETGKMAVVRGSVTVNDTVYADGTIFSFDNIDSSVTALEESVLAFLLNEKEGEG